MNFSAESLVNKLKAFWQQQGWDFHNTPTLLAVSGGQDSMLMAQLFLHCGFPFQMAHANFQLRGKDSDEDEAFVKKWATENGIIVHRKKIDLSSYVNANTQVAARETRYLWFAELMQKNNMKFLATAHHHQDSIETFLMNFGRGSGLKGLLGIPFQREQIIRPLSPLLPKEIDWLSTHFQLSWRADSSNAETKYLRNKIRLEVIPKLVEAFPNFQQKSKDTLAHLQSDFSLLQELIDNYKKELIHKKDALYQVNLTPISNHREKVNLLFHVLRPWKFNINQCQQIWEAFAGQDGAQFFSPNAHAALRSKTLIIDQEPLPKDLEIHIEKNQQSIDLPGGRLLLSKEKVPTTFVGEKNIAELDYDKIQWPLTIRLWQKGDSYQPLGMNGKQQKLQDFFSNNKYSITEKNRQLLVLSKSTIVWILQARIAQPFAIDDQSKNCLKLEWITD